MSKFLKKTLGLQTLVPQRSAAYDSSKLSSSTARLVHRYGVLRFHEPVALTPSGSKFERFFGASSHGALPSPTISDDGILSNPLWLIPKKGTGGLS